LPAAETTEKEISEDDDRTNKQHASCTFWEKMGERERERERERDRQTDRQLARIKTNLNLN